MLPAHSTTIEEFIKAGKNVSLSYKDFSFLETMDNNTQVSVFNVVNDYMTEIRKAAVLVKLSDSEYRKYMYKPKLLCSDIYGNPELYFIILLLNDMADVKEFDRRTFYMLNRDYMSLITSYIYNAEKKPIDIYNNEFSDK